MFSGIGTRVQARYEARRTSFGTPIRRIHDATDYTAVIAVLAPEEVDRLQLETGQNAADRNAVVLHLPLDCAMGVGDFVLVPASAPASTSRYRVVSVPPPPIVSGVVSRILAVCFFDPDRS